MAGACTSTKRGEFDLRLGRGLPDPLMDRDGPCFCHLPFASGKLTAHRSGDIGEAADQLCGEHLFSQRRKTAALAPKMETRTGVCAIRQLWMDRRPESGVLPQGDQLQRLGFNSVSVH
jgi:hypothetical protein